jgi:hypothetical protein
MMNNFTLMALLLLCGIAATAQQSRLVGTHVLTYSGGTMVPYDTARMLYAAGNGYGGDAQAYQYDTLKNDTTVRVLYQSGTGYYEFERRIYRLGASGRRDTILIQRKDPPVTGAWYTQDMTVHTYDGSNNRTMTIDYTYSTSTSSLYIMGKHTNTYTGGNLTESMYQYYNTATSTYVNQSKRIYVFTGGNMTEYRYEVWDPAGSVWKPYSRNTYTYDGNNNELSQVLESWNNTAGAYENTNLVEYTYDANNNQTSYIHKQWVGGAWQNWIRHIYLYDGANHMVTDSNYQWNTTGSMYDLVNLSTMHYTANLRDTTIVRAIVSSNLDTVSRVVNTYNTLGQLTRWHTQNYTAGTWAYGTGNYDYKYYYSSFTGVATKTAGTIGVSLYPNPATDMLHIKVRMQQPQPYTVAIYSTTGAVLRQWQETGAATRTIPVGDLQAGTYILSVGNGREKTAIPFIIAR